MNDLCQTCAHRASNETGGFVCTKQAPAAQHRINGRPVTHCSWFLDPKTGRRSLLEPTRSR